MLLQIFTIIQIIIVTMYTLRIIYLGYIILQLKRLTKERDRIITEYDKSQIGEE